MRIGNRREINPDKTPLELAMQRAAYALRPPNRRQFPRGRHAPDAGTGSGRQDRDRAQRTRPRRGSPPTPLPGRPRRVVVVANLRPEKGHDVLIEAAVPVLRRFPDARFEIVGGGTGAVEARALEPTPGVCAHAFSFLGHCEDVAARLAAADIFVLPSRSEAFPNAVLEAMAAGLPIVASGVGGVGELVEEGQTGMLVPPDDPGSLADRLSALMAEPSPWRTARHGGSRPRPGTLLVRPHGGSV